MALQSLNPALSKTPDWVVLCKRRRGCVTIPLAKGLGSTATHLNSHLAVSRFPWLLSTLAKASFNPGNSTDRPPNQM